MLTSAFKIDVLTYYKLLVSYSIDEFWSNASMTVIVDIRKKKNKDKIKIEKIDESHSLPISYETFRLIGKS